MFGTNEVIGRSKFKDAPLNSLKVTSIFFTLQGEGPYRGMPALFIRLTHCNLACSFCDSYFDSGDWFTYEELEAKCAATIRDYYASRSLPVPSFALGADGKSDGVVLVLTGGEPTLQLNLSKFLERQVPMYAAVQIESNGIPKLDICEGVTLVVSPKCAEREGVATRYLKPGEHTLERADTLKFVMVAEADSPYSSIPDWAHEWAATTGKPVFISPMNIYNKLPEKAKLLRARKGEITLAERSTADEIISFWEPGLLDMAANQRNHEHAARYCIDHGFIFNMQLHLFASLA